MILEILSLNSPLPQLSVALIVMPLMIVQDAFLVIHLLFPLHLNPVDLQGWSTRATYLFILVANLILILLKYEK